MPTDFYYHASDGSRSRPTNHTTIRKAACAPLRAAGAALRPPSSLRSSGGGRTPPTISPHPPARMRWPTPGRLRVPPAPLVGFASAGGATKVNGGTTYSGMYFELANDIAYTYNTQWDDDGSTAHNFGAMDFDGNSFYGTFDGKGHTISGIRIYNPNTYCQGLFGYLEGTVKNLTLADARITGGDYAGGIAGYNAGTIENCHVTGTVTVYAEQSSSNHGGIAGNVTYSGIVNGCTSAT